MTDNNYIEQDISNIYQMQSADIFFDLQHLNGNDM